jgi:hypothetical protein
MSGVVLVNAAGVLSLLSYQKLYLRGKNRTEAKVSREKNSKQGLKIEKSVVLQAINLIFVLFFSFNKH